MKVGALCVTAVAVGAVIGVVGVIAYGAYHFEQVPFEEAPWPRPWDPKTRARIAKAARWN